MQKILTQMCHKDSKVWGEPRNIKIFLIPIKTRSAMADYHPGVWVSFLLPESLCRAIGNGLLTVKQVSQFVQATPAHVRQMLASGRLRGYLAEGSWRVNPADLVLYLEELRN